MTRSVSEHAKLWVKFVALLVVSVLFIASRSPRLDARQRTELVHRFRFAVEALAEPPGATEPRHIRQVHPSLERIAAWISSLGAAATLADLDGNGRPDDAIVVDPRFDTVTVDPIGAGPPRFARFVLELAGAGVDLATMAPTGTLCGDFNRDGWLDLLVYFWGRSPLLFLRDPSATELRSTAFASAELVDPPQRWYTNSAVQADVDGDGRIDLILSNYFQDDARILDAHDASPQVMHAGKANAANGGTKRLLLATSAAADASGPQLFREQPAAFPPRVATAWTLATGAADLDGDLLPELYFANDFGPDFLLHNRSTPGRIEFVLLDGERDLWSPKSCVLGHDSFKGMGVDFGDVNHDGALDIYVSNIATKFGLTESHFLWLSQGGPEFVRERALAGRAAYRNASEPLGLSRSGWGWDCRLVDFDGDGQLEAIQGLGFLRGTTNRWPELQALGTSNSTLVKDPRFWPTFRAGADLSGNERTPLFVRAGGGRFYDIGDALFPQQGWLTRGIAIGDVDDDGRLDALLANQWGVPQLLHNQNDQQNLFLGLRLVTAPPAGGDLNSGIPAIGAQAYLEDAVGSVAVGQVDGGSGHSGKRAPEIYFGLGRSSGQLAKSITLRWIDSAGARHHSQLVVDPGWNTIALGRDGRAVVLRGRNRS